MADNKKKEQEPSEKKQRAQNKKLTKKEEEPKETKDKKETKDIKEEVKEKGSKKEQLKSQPELSETLKPSKESKESPNQISILSNLIKYEKISSKKLKTDNYIHSSLIDLCLKFDNGLIRGSNKRCLAFLECMKQILKDYKLPPNSIMNRDLERKIDLIVDFLRKYGIVDEGIFTFIKTMKYYLRFIPHDSVEENKTALLSHVELFKEDKIIKADEKIVHLAQDIIKTNDIIMTFGYSGMISKLLKREFKAGKVFQVISVDNYPFNEGRTMNEELLKVGINCTYTLLNSVTKFLPKVNKIIVGASSILVNGYCLSRVGTAMLACLAHNYMKPFIVFCETYKLSERSQLDPFSLNEFTDPAKIVGKNKVHPDVVTVNMRWDLTPRKYISMIVTELGKFPASSVPVLLRELEKVNYDIEILKK